VNAKYLDHGRTTVYILPLKSMHEQYRLVAAQANLTAEVYGRSSSTTRPSQIVLVTIESTQSEAFHNYLTTLYHSHLLARLVVDEAHLIESHSHFRPVMGTMTWAGSVGIPIILESASVPPILQDKLFKRFGITNYVVCREKTSRPNISYNVIRHTDNDVIPRVVDLYQQIIDNPKRTGKIIIFVHSREDGRRLSHLIDVTFVDADTSQIDDILAQYRGSKRTVISTPYLGVCLNIPDILWVVHAGYPFNMLAFIQETGRVGRDSNTFATSFVVLPRDGYPHKRPSIDLVGTALVVAWCDNDKYCRSLYLSTYNDGVGEPCTMMTRVSHLCDNCVKDVGIVSERGEPNVFDSSVIAPYLPISDCQLSMHAKP
jgi:superfamily II DNA helicase RecQ